MGPPATTPGNDTQAAARRGAFAPEPRPLDAGAGASYLPAMAFALVHHPDYVVSLPPGHSFPMDKYGMLMLALADLGTVFDTYVPEPAPLEWIEAVHDPAYVAAVVGQRLTRDQERRIGFPVDARMVRRSLLAIGGTYLAGRIALDRGFCANTAGGSHHALPDGGAGYCVFNDLAVAGARLLAEGRVRRIAYVDLDVHQGDGTATIFAGREDAVTLSLHAAKNFPVRKAQSTRDVALADGVDDQAYLDVLAAELPAFLDAHRPELVFYQAGVDAHADDRLGRLSLSDDGLVRRDRAVVAACRARGIPLASTLGGGYGVDRAAVALRHARSIDALGNAAAGAADRVGAGAAGRGF